MLTFYSNPLSPFASKVHFFLEEAGLPYKYVKLDLRKGDQHHEDFLKVNPLAQVPAIEWNGFSMSESNAIMRYLAAKTERFELYPANLEDRARVDTMTEFCNLHINRFLISIAWNLHFVPKFFNAEPNMPVVEEARASLLKNMGKLERHLSGQTFLAGATASIADCTLLPFMALHKEAELSLADYPNTQAWLTRMTERPAWAKFQASMRTHG